MSGVVNTEEYLFESSLSVTGRHQIVDRAEREPINALVWQNLGRYDWLSIGENSANLRLTTGSNHFTGY